MGLNRRIKNGSILIAVLVIMLVICQGAWCRETNNNENYEMKVIKIQNVIFPKLENSFVKKEFGVSSTKKYMEKLKRNIYNTKYNMEVERVKGELMNIVINNSSITCSEKEMEEQFKELKQSYEKYAELYGMSYIETLEKFGTNDKKMKKQVIQNIKENTVSDIIIKSEGLECSKKKYEKLEMDYVSQYGYDTIAEFISDNGKDYLESEVNKEIVKDYLYAHAIISKREK